jgi:hypothetical protein
MTRTLSARLSWLRRDIESAIDGARHCPAVLSRLRRARAEIVAAQGEASEPPQPPRPPDPRQDGDVRDLRGVV